jgi:hypothetical protein
MEKLIKVIKKIAVQMLLSKDMKSKIIKNLNKKVNIPLIDEKTEAEFLEGMYDAMQEAITDAIEDSK